jgi:hypothetical protein
MSNNQKQYVSVNSLSQIDKDRLKGVIREMNDSMTRVAAERELQKEIVDKICDDLGLDKKLVKRMAKVYFKANFNTEIEENKTFEDFYTIVMNVTT